MNLTLFFTYGTALADWEQNGSLDREISIYGRIAAHFETVYFVTYGHDDKRLSDRLPKNIIILPKKIALPNVLYSLLIPILFQKELRSCDWLKTNQMLGSWSAVLAKLLFGNKLLLRTGYTESLSPIGKNSFRRAVTHLVETLAYKYATTSVVTSEEQKEYLATTHDARNIHVIPNGIDTDRFSPIKDKSTGKKTRLLFVGRLHPEKNLLNLLDAIRELPVQLLMVGKGPLEPNIRKRANDLDIDLEITPSIPNSELPATYSAADIYIQPSLYEGNPKTILEAMSCGLPVIATDVKGINTIIQHKENGYLCTTNPSSIREAVTALIHDPNSRLIFGNNARIYIKNNYDMMDMINTELKIYKTGTDELC
jgi:glycosyltransferase involved in cell wall biosynthesis